MVGDDVIEALAICAMEPAAVHDLYHDVESPKILPDPQSTKKLTWVWINSKVPRAGEKAQKMSSAEAEFVMRVREKKEWEEVTEGEGTGWPYRDTLGKSQRRARITDMLLLFRRKDRLSFLEKVLTSMARNFDYVLVLNLLVAAYIFGEVWWYKLRKVGLFDGDLDHFVLVAKWLNDKIKFFGLTDPDPFWYVELSNLVGLRNPGFGDWDKIEEVRKLAEGGLDFDFFGMTFESEFRRHCPLIPGKVEAMSFFEYIDSLNWVTAGSSTIGELRVEDSEGKIHVIGCRKNTLKAVFTTKQLYDEAMNPQIAPNFGIEKAEKAKQRIVVKSTVRDYLRDSYIIYLTGGAAKKVEGIVKGQTPYEEFSRLMQMIKNLETDLGLGFDYKGFDHQPTTEQLVTIMKGLADCGRRNCRQSDLTEFDEITKMSIFSLRNSIVTAVDGKRSETFRVTGGLLSGLAATSSFGDLWNKTMTGAMLELSSRFGVVNGHMAYESGDDSAIFPRNWASGVINVLCFSALGVEGGEGKFSLRGNRPGVRKNGAGGEIEFLRQDISIDGGVKGYPARAIGGITGKGGTADSGWTTYATMTAWKSASATLVRRIPSRRKEVEEIWDHLSGVWLRNLSLPRAIVYVPVASGGLGLMPVEIGVKYSVNERVFANPTKDVKILDVNPENAATIQRYASERYNLALDGAFCQKLAEDDFSNTLLGDNLPEVSSMVRRSWNKKVKDARIKVTKTRERFAPAVLPFKMSLITPTDYKLGLGIAENLAISFGSRPGLGTVVEDWKKFRPPDTLRSWIKKFDPSSWTALQWFSSSWHLTDRINYLLGELSPQVDWLHPKLLSMLSVFTAALNRPRAKHINENFGWTASQLQGELFNSTLSNYLTWN